MRNRPTRLSLICGLAVAAVVAVLGLGYVFTRPVQVSATAATVVLPSDTVAPGDAPGYYETLSRGQIPETYAQILRLPRFSREAADKLGFTLDEAKSATETVTVVPNTAIINVNVTAPTARVAVGMADGIVSGAKTYVAELKQPYQLSIVNNAAGTIAPVGLAKIPFALVILVAAAALGLATQQVVWHLGRALGAGGDGAIPTLVRIRRTEVDRGDTPSGALSAAGRSTAAMTPASVNGAGTATDAGLYDGRHDRSGAAPGAPAAPGITAATGNGRWDAELYQDARPDSWNDSYGVVPPSGTPTSWPVAPLPPTPWPTAALPASAQDAAAGWYDPDGAGATDRNANANGTGISGGAHEGPGGWPTDPETMTRW